MSAEVEAFVLDGPNQGRSLILRVGVEVKVGRQDVDRSFDLNLSEPVVSSPHVALTYNGQTIEVRDLMARNGTTVDNQTLKGGAVAVVPVGSVIHLAYPRGPRLSLRQLAAPAVLAPPPAKYVPPSVVNAPPPPAQSELSSLQARIEQLEQENQALRNTAVRASQTSQASDGRANINWSRVAACLQDFREKLEALQEMVPEDCKSELHSTRARLRDLERMLGLTSPPTGSAPG